VVASFKNMSNPEHTKNDPMNRVEAGFVVAALTSFLVLMAAIGAMAFI
jgi:hypothetical protein